MKKILFKYSFILLFISHSIFSYALENPEKGGVLLKDPTYKKQYNFSSDWFTKHIPLWKEFLHPFKGKPDIHYLEIGVFEGRSAIWMLENILTHPTAKLTGIDTFTGDLKERFLANLKISGFENKVTTIKGRSQVELTRLPYNSFDIIYIDGSHYAIDALADAVFSWPLLKNEGLLIFDDYLYDLESPLRARPKIAIDIFTAIYRDDIKIVHHGYQVILEKRNSASLFGNVFFYWSMRVIIKVIDLKRSIFRFLRSLPRLYKNIYYRKNIGN